MKNLPFDPYDADGETSNFIVVRMDRQRKAYLFPYKLANAFYRGFMGFKNTSSRVTHNLVKTVYVDEYESKGGYTNLRYQSEFMELSQYLAMCEYGKFKYTLDYDICKNMYSLNSVTIRAMERCAKA